MNLFFESEARGAVSISSGLSWSRRARNSFSRLLAASCGLVKGSLIYKAKGLDHAQIVVMGSGRCMQLCLAAITYYDSGRIVIVAMQVLAGVLMIIAALKFRPKG